MKYNDNGEYKDIYVKSFDTLPVGAEVDFDGSVVPEGWTAVEDVKTYTLTPKYSVYVSDYQLFKVGKVVTLTTNNIWLDNSITAQTWKEVATLPSEIRPKKNINVSCVLVDGDTENLLSPCKVSIDTSGVIKIKTTTNQSVTNAMGVNFGITYLTN